MNRRIFCFFCRKPAFSLGPCGVQPVSTAPPHLFLPLPAFIFDQTLREQKRRQQVRPTCGREGFLDTKVSRVSPIVCSCLSCSWAMPWNLRRLTLVGRIIVNNDTVAAALGTAAPLISTQSCTLERDTCDFQRSKMMCMYLFVEIVDVT